MPKSSQPEKINIHWESFWRAVYEAAATLPPDSTDVRQDQT